MASDFVIFEDRRKDDNRFHLSNRRGEPLCNNGNIRDSKITGITSKIARANDMVVCGNCMRKVPNRK